jgi:hypothetical protein
MVAHSCATNCGVEMSAEADRDENDGHWWALLVARPPRPSGMAQKLMVMQGNVSRHDTYDKERQRRINMSKLPECDVLPVRSGQWVVFQSVDDDNDQIVYGWVCRTTTGAFIPIATSMEHWPTPQTSLPYLRRLPVQATVRDAAICVLSQCFGDTAASVLREAR